MSYSQNTIAKNTSVLIVSQAITWSLTLLLTIFLPRYLGAAGIGKLHLATSLWLIMGVLVTFGTDLLLAKEIARNPQRMSDLFGSALLLRFILFSLSAIVLLSILYFFGYPRETIYVVGLAGVANLAWQFVAVCQAVQQGVEKMEFFSLGNIIGNAVHTLLILLLIYLGGDLYGVALLAIVPATVNLLIQLFFLKRIFKLQIFFRTATMFYLLQKGVPYLFSTVFFVASTQIDTVMISALVDERAVGWYSIASRLYGMLLFIPTAYITVLYPVYSRSFEKEPGRLPQLLAKNLHFILLLGIPLGLGMIVIADPLVALLYGAAFAPSGPIVAVIGLVVIFTFPNMVIGQFLISTDRQNAWTAVMAIATVGTLLLDLWLIPWCEALWQNGALGGALAFVVTESGMFIAGLLLLPRGTLGAHTVAQGLRITTAGLLMALLIWPLRSYFVAVPILAGMLIYLTLALVLRLVSKEEMTTLLGWIQHVQRRFSRSPVEAAGS